MMQREEPYNLVEAEMIMNFFPHIIWRNEYDLASL